MVVEVLVFLSVFISLFVQSKMSVLFVVLGGQFNFLDGMHCIKY